MNCFVKRVSEKSVQVLGNKPERGVCVFDDELDRMCRAIRFCREAGANGIVTGVMTTDGSVDIKAMNMLIKESGNLEVTFHRAFDECREPFKALEDIISLGCSRLLTSGQAESAFSGRGLIAELVKRSSGRIIIMPGSGITPENLSVIAEATAAVEFHGTKLCRL